MTAPCILWKRRYINPIIIIIIIIINENILFLDSEYNISLLFQRSWDIITSALTLVASVLSAFKESILPGIPGYFTCVEIVMAKVVALAGFRAPTL